MTTQTLRNGDGKDLAMQPGETMLVVAVTGSYSASIIAGTGAPSVIATDATGGSYGPYAKGAVVRLRSSALSEIDFDIGTAPVVVSDTPVMAATNPLTGGLESLTVGGTPVLALGATIDQRDPMGRVTQFTTSGVAYAVVYGVFGIQTITGGGVTRTVSYNAKGQVSGVSNVAA